MSDFHVKMTDKDNNNIYPESRVEDVVGLADSLTDLSGKTTIKLDGTPQQNVMFVESPLVTGSSFNKIPIQGSGDNLAADTIKIGFSGAQSGFFMFHLYVIGLVTVTNNYYALTNHIVYGTINPTICAALPVALTNTDANYNPASGIVVEQVSKSGYITINAPTNFTWPYKWVVVPVVGLIPDIIEVTKK